MNHSLTCLLALATLAILHAAPEPRSDGLVAHWAFETLEAADGRVMTNDPASGRLDEVRGHSRLQEGVRGNCMVLNEYDRELIRPAGSGSLINSKAFTFEAWIAPRSYPWNWAPILTQRDETAGLYFGIDGDGRLGLHVVVDGKWLEGNSEMPFGRLLTEHQWNSDSRKWQYFGPGNPPAPDPFGERTGKPTIPLLRWSHVAGTFDPAVGMRIHLDGKPLMKLPPRCLPGSVAALGFLVSTVQAAGAFQGGGQEGRLEGDHRRSARVRSRLGDRDRHLDGGGFRFVASARQGDQAGAFRAQPHRRAVAITGARPQPTCAHWW